MKKIALIGAMKSEISVFIRDFNAEETKIPGIYRGFLDDKEIFICQSGIGKVNAAIATQRLIDLFGAEYIINSGVAGGVSGKLSKLDIVISEKLTYHDFTPLDILDNNPPYSKYMTADKNLVSKALEACSKLAIEIGKNNGNNFSAFPGVIVSGDCFVNSAEQANRLNRDFGALCTEMEGAAIAHVAVVNKIPFVIIRAISDFADEDAENSFDSFEYIAADRAAFIVKEIISSL